MHHYMHHYIGMHRCVFEGSELIVARVFVERFRAPLREVQFQFYADLKNFLYACKRLLDVEASQAGFGKQDLLDTVADFERKANIETRGLWRDVEKGRSKL